MPRKRGERRRLILQHATNRHGTTYRYFFCTGRYDHVCTLPYLGVARVEAAIEDHYATLRFNKTFVAETQEHVRTTVAAEAASARLLHQQLTKQLRELDVKESNLIDLAADGKLAQDKIRTKLHDITLRRERLTTRLKETNDELGDAARLVEACLELLRNPQELYARCDETQRRLLNEALFETLYLDEELDGELTVTHQLKEPFAKLHGLQQTQAQAATVTGDTFSGVTGADDDESYNDSGTRLPQGAGATDDSLGVLLASTWMARGSSRSCMVALRDSLSNPSIPLLRLVTALRTGQVEASEAADVAEELVEGSVAVDVQENRILSPDEVATLVNAYRGGASMLQLAKRFGVHRHTVDRHLARAGAVKRPLLKMGPEVLAEAVALYSQGLSVAAVGKKLGLSASTVYSTFVREGVKMRRSKRG